MKKLVKNMIIILAITVGFSGFLCAGPQSIFTWTAKNAIQGLRGSDKKRILGSLNTSDPVKKGILAGMLGLFSTLAMFRVITGLTDQTPQKSSLSDLLLGAFKFSGLKPSTIQKKMDRGEELIGKQLGLAPEQSNLYDQQVTALVNGGATLVNGGMAVKNIVKGIFGGASSPSVAQANNYQAAPIASTVALTPEKRERISAVVNTTQELVTNELTAACDAIFVKGTAGSSLLEHIEKNKDIITTIKQSARFNQLAKQLAALEAEGAGDQDYQQVIKTAAQMHERVDQLLMCVDRLLPHLKGAIKNGKFAPSAVLIREFDQFQTTVNQLQTMVTQLHNQVGTGASEDTKRKLEILDQQVRSIADKLGVVALQNWVGSWGVKVDYSAAIGAKLGALFGR